MPGAGALADFNTGMLAQAESGGILIEPLHAELTAVKKGMGDLVTTGSLAGEFKNCTVTAGAKTGSAQVGDVVPDGVYFSSPYGSSVPSGTTV